MKYRSKTKGSVPIEKMDDTHIINALKKAKNTLGYDPVIKRALQEELDKRGIVVGKKK